VYVFVFTEKESVVSVFESTIHHLHTTRSWDFMESNGLGSNIDGQFRKFTKKKNHVIVGHIDSGKFPFFFLKLKQLFVLIYLFEY
jgi:hypothetical protein